MKYKVIKALQLCSEKKCDQCSYNRWVREVCQTHLCRDAVKVIEKLNEPIQYEMDIPTK
jgi:hypothetical protein